VHQQLCFAPSILHVRPWHDDVIDHVGFDARSSYVEDYWLGILGPSTTWLLRRMAAGFEYSPEGFDLDLAETARSLGLGDQSGRSSAFLRAVNRLVQFNLAQLSGPDELTVRQKVPPLTRTQVRRLSPALQARHAAWQDDELRSSPDEQRLRRARLLALSLLELGEDYGGAERQLLRWHYPALVAREAVTWAGSRRDGVPRDGAGPDDLGERVQSSGLLA
jgi:hypothetical protein